MPRVISDDGPLAARIVVVGEMDASQEEAQGRHFVGLAGQEWNRWLTHAGLRRQDIRVTNVVPYRAHPSNKIAAVGHDELERNILALHERLAALTAPIVLVPMGNVALRALTGKTGITKWRGSILSYTDLRGRTIKVIPTLHPASLLYRKGETAAMYGASSGAETGWLKRCHLDWQRVATDSQFPELRLPQRTRLIEPTWTDVCDYVEDARQRAEILVLDIETPHGVEVVPGRVLKNGTQQWKRVKGARRMTVFGASHEPSLGIAIPTTKEYWADRGVDVQDVFTKIRELCALPGVTLGGQSGAGFDRVWLHWYGVETPNYVWDTRWLSHSHDPLDDHALAYQASTLTREPYWKCLQGDVEVLTPMGWKRFDTLNDVATAMVYQPGSGQLSFAACTVRKAAFDGAGARIRALRHDTWYTPNHRVITRDDDWAEVWKVPATCGLRVAGDYVGAVDFRWIRLLVAIQADGHHVRHATPTTIEFTFSRRRKIRRLLALAPNFHEYPSSRKGYRRLSGFLRGAAVEESMRLLGSEKLFGPWLLDFDGPTLDAFLEELVHWDGWVTHGGKALNYASKHHVNVEWVATIAHLRGRSAYIASLLDKKTGSRAWKVSIRSRADIATRSRHWSLEPYQGDVYCLTTPTGAFLARSHGHIFVTGNSDGREDDTEREDTYDLKTYWRYNCSDSTVTRELVDVWLEKLDPERLAFYLRRYAALFDPMLAMSVGGIRMAEPRRLRAATRFLAEAVAIRQKLAAHAGFELTGDKGSLSSKKLQAFLYQKLRLPERRDRKTHALSTNEVTVRKLMLTPQGKRVLGTDSKADAERPGPLILRHRRLEALQRFTKEGISDADGYARSQIGLTYTLRFTMGSSPRGTGNNNQNTDRELLSLYVPDENHVFLETDLSQAEDRVVKVLSAACTEDPGRRGHLLERARARPWENDEHWRAAELIFGKPRAALDKELHRNQVGKRSRHAGNYGMRGGTMAEQCLKAGYVFTDAECDGFISTLLDQDTPEVKLWQAWVRKLIMREKRLTTSWGHTVNVEYEALDDNLYRKMYALEPQNSVTGIIKYWGLVPLHTMLVERQLDARIANEKHDSLLISTHPRHVYDIMEFLRNKLERERSYRGIPLTIWTEFKLGKTAAMSVEFKKFPTRDDVEAAVEALR